jgi:hypothetical protein
MRKTIVTGLTTVMAVAAVAGPAYAQAPAPPVVPAIPVTPSNAPVNPTTPTNPTNPPNPNAPIVVPAQPQTGATMHIRPFTVKHSRNAGGYTYAYASIVGSNLPNPSVKVNYKVNLKTFNPGTPGPWRKTSGSVALPGGDTILSLKFGFRGKSVAQVRKALKITISNATNGATITSGTSVASVS